MGYGNMEHALYRTGTVRGRTALLCAALGGCAFPGEQDFSLRNRRPASQPVQLELQRVHVLCVHSDLLYTEYDPRDPGQQTKGHDLRCGLKVRIQEYSAWDRNCFCYRTGEPAASAAIPIDSNIAKQQHPISSPIRK